jgi:hypothetical protein
VDEKWKGGTVRLDKETRAEVSRVASEMAGIARSGPALPGTLTQRHTRCGRAGCRCGADPPQPHGPYWSWTRKVNNKTVTRYLSDEEVADYEAFFDNAKRLRALLGELENLGLSVIEGTTAESKEPSSRSESL